MTEDAFLAMLGGSIMLIGFFAIVLYVLLIIANWKIFTKAGEAGWKSLIPIYNLYVLLKVVGMKTWFWILLAVSCVAGFITGLAPNAASWISICEGIFMLVFDIVFSSKLAKAFGKGTGFSFGLFLLPNIFTLILAFGSAEYQGIEE